MNDNGKQWMDPSGARVTERRHKRTALRLKKARYTSLNDTGNAYLEYFVLALIALLATFTFFNGGFRDTQTHLGNVFDDLARRVAPAPSP